MTSTGQATAETLSDARIHELAEQFVGFLKVGSGFRNGSKAGMMFVFFQGDGITPDNRMGWVERVTAGVAQLDASAQRQIGEGLSETRVYLGEREAGLRTMGAVSLWEHMVSALPLEMQHQARAGE